MGFRRALDLADLVERFVAGAGGVVRGIDWLAVEVYDLIKECCTVADLRQGVFNKKAVGFIVCLKLFLKDQTIFWRLNCLSSGSRTFNHIRSSWDNLIFFGVTWLLLNYVFLIPINPFLLPVELVMFIPV